MMLEAQARVVREKLTFPNRNGEWLAALLEYPVFKPAAFVLFAHCFTCSKNIGAATRISRALAGKGFGVLRFDFTGLGNSEGDFANTNFTSNMEDLVCAADYLRQHYAAPAVLIGHSLGGAAVVAAAASVPEARAVVTIGAPSDPAHIGHLLHDSIEQIEARGYAEVEIAGRRFTLKKQFLDDIAEHTLVDKLQQMRKALLIFHSPVDDIVEIEHARHIFEAAKHPKSFISLDKADHMLSRQQDAEYVAETITAWASRYVADGERSQTPPMHQLEQGEVLVRDAFGTYAQEVFTDTHRLLADEPVDQGGQDTGPSPYEFLLTALGTCTAITLRMYANLKKLPLEHISVKLKHSRTHAKDCVDCESENQKIDLVERELEVQGDLTSEQRDRLLIIANKCPVHKTLTSITKIETRLKVDANKS